MTISNIDVEVTIDRVTALIAAEKDISPALKTQELLVSHKGLLTSQRWSFVSELDK